MAIEATVPFTAPTVDRLSVRLVVDSYHDIFMPKTEHPHVKIEHVARMPGRPTETFACLNVVLGSTLAPIVLTFFVSWLSETITIVFLFFFAALIVGAFDGIRKRTRPVVGSYADAPRLMLPL